MPGNIRAAINISNVNVLYIFCYNSVRQVHFCVGIVSTRIQKIFLFFALSFKSEIGSNEIEEVFGFQFKSIDKLATQLQSYVFEVLK
jgi:hypothetical protein